MLTNKLLYEKHISMWIDEDKTMLNISDHNLVRAWFHIGGENFPNIKKEESKRNYLDKQRTRQDKSMC